MENNNKPLSIEQKEKEESKKLIQYHDVKNTPFTICKRQEESEKMPKYYILCHGRVMTYPFDTFKEAKDAIKYHSWDLLTAFVFLISEIQQTNKKQEETK